MAASSDEEGNEGKGSMWVLEQKLDQPMDEEAGRLKNMYREKVKRKKVVFPFFSCVKPENITFVLL